MSTSSIFQPSALVANVNDWDPDPTSGIYGLIWLISATTPVDITGFAGHSYPGFGELETRLVYWRNVGAQTITIKYQDSSSSAVNRFALKAGADLSFPANGVVQLLYDSVNHRWFNV